MIPPSTALRGAYLAAALALGGLLSCGTPDAAPARAAVGPDGPGFFNLAEWAEREAARLAGTRIDKYVRVGETTEERDGLAVDWTEELAPFAQSNVDRPALWDAYRADTAALAGGGALVTYAALDSALFTREVRVRFADRAAPYDTVARIEIANRFDSYVAATEQRLAYAPGAYEVVSRQDARFLEPRVLRITAGWTAPAPR